jgi:hypothetical protein
MARDCAGSQALSDNDGHESYDAYGFPTTQDYVPSSHVAPLGKHQERWARFWWGETSGGRTSLPESVRKSARLRALVFSGVPVAFRGVVWCELLGVSAVRRKHPDGYYQSLHSEAAGGDDLDHRAATQVAKDVDRTWPQHRWLNREALYRVLVAYARRNQDVGYCQGLNSVVGTLLLFMGEEDAFWCLTQLVEARLARGFWSSTLWRCRAEQEVLKALLARREPTITRQLEASRIALELFSTGWWLTLFVSDLPLETALRVWEVLMLADGDAGTSADDGAFGMDVLLAASMALLAMRRPELRRGGAVEMSMAMREGPRSLQPDTAAGRAFLARFHSELVWLRQVVPTALLRRHAIAKVQRRLALVQRVREGTATTAELHADASVHETVAVGEATWLLYSVARLLPSIPSPIPSPRMKENVPSQLVQGGDIELSK